MDLTKCVDYSVFLIGMLSVAGIAYISSALEHNLPSGYFVFGAPSCCDECSCLSEEVCKACGSCCYTAGCGICGGGQGGGVLELVHSGRVLDGGSFTVNAVIRYPVRQSFLVELEPPNGFYVDGNNPVKVELDSHEMKVVPFNVIVREHVAEQDYIVRARLVDSNWNVVSSAEAVVSVFRQK